jgi:uncharacterized repeat protein (TIGR03803 family)
MSSASKTEYIFRAGIIYLYLIKSIHMNICTRRTGIFLFASSMNILCSSLFMQCFAQNSVYLGMTEDGGSNGAGAIVSFNPSTNNEAVVWNFGSGKDAAFPRGNLVYDPANGLYYGMTRNGGTNGTGIGGGTIISFNPANNAENVVWNLGGAGDGSVPHGSLLYDTNNGLFYGMTTDGGSRDSGTIISFNPANNQESVLWSFGIGTDGFYPVGSLAYDPVSGIIYGMTENGGSNNHGAIISLNPANNAEDVVWSFAGAPSDGLGPYGALVFDTRSGLFYGMTAEGGNGAGVYGGTIFTFNPANNTENVVWNFGNGKDGQFPEGELVYQSGDGLYYGLTYTGGSKFQGTVFSFNPANNKDSVLWNFGNGSDGTEPWGDLIYNSDDGLYYGMATVGGSNNAGAIFSFNTATHKDSILWNFGNGTDGEFPFGSFVLYTPSTGINAINKSSSNIDVYPNPNRGRFTVDLHNAGQKTQLEIFNALGEKIYMTKLNSDNEQIDLSEQASGIYLCYVFDESGRQIDESKFIVE